MLAFRKLTESVIHDKAYNYVAQDSQVNHCELSCPPHTNTILPLTMSDILIRFNGGEFYLLQHMSLSVYIYCTKVDK